MGRLPVKKPKDVQKHNAKLNEVFKDIKRKTLKSELIAICDVMEGALMELTIAIKNDDKPKLVLVKEMLSSAVYGGKE